MNFDRLASLCHDTHLQLITAASRVIGTHLAARNSCLGTTSSILSRKARIVLTMEADAKGFVTGFEVCCRTWVLRR